MRSVLRIKMSEDLQNCYLDSEKKADDQAAAQRVQTHRIFQSIHRVETAAIYVLPMQWKCKQLLRDPSKRSRSPKQHKNAHCRKTNCLDTLQDRQRNARRAPRTWVLVRYCYKHYFQRDKLYKLDNQTMLFHYFQTKIAVEFTIAQPTSSSFSN